MNRIAGIFNFDQTNADPVALEWMVNAMKLQEQEQPRLRIEGHVGFAIVSSGNQSSDPDGISLKHRPGQRLMIAFDGRIDNRQELYALLRSQLFVSSEQISNEEFVLVAYEKWGLDFPQHLIGDFALALWDKKEQRLVCVRDHFGVKPFYYSVSRETFVFASTPLAVLASGVVQARIHEERVADHLVNPLEGVDKTSTFYKDIFRLPPAHMLIVQVGETISQRYWELHPVIHVDLKSDDDYIEVFREMLEGAVRCRLRDTAVTATMLSGGMDSASIAGMGRKILLEERKNPLQAFAAISNSPDINRETSSIFSVLGQGNLQSHRISETEVLQCMDELVKAIEMEAEPFDCLMNLNRSVYLHARDQNFSAVLDGVDGDVLLSGSGQLLQLWLEGDFHSILGETFGADGLTAEYKMGRYEFFTSLLSMVALMVPEWIREKRRRMRYRRTAPTAVRETVIHREFAIRSQLGERFCMLDSHRPRPPSLKQVEFHKISLDHPFLTVGLERYERVAGAFGIEACHPLLDVRLAEFCLGLPWQLKTHHGWTKMILRRTMEPYLPPEVVWRRDKDSLMWEYNRLILKNRAEYFRQATLDEQEALRPYVDTRKLEGFWQEYLTRGEEKHAEHIWSGIALAFWLRRHRNIVANLNQEH